MFRLQDNVPDIYVNESRDFQLICRVYDLIINGVMFDINSISNINNPMKVNDRLLKLYCSKVGFFTNREIVDDALRVILTSFNSVIKFKGTKKGIERAVCTILKLEGSFERPTIIIDNENYNIQILTPITIYNRIALHEYLKYVIPAGYTYTVENVIADSVRLTELDVSDTIHHQLMNTPDISQIVGSNKSVEGLTECNGVDYLGVLPVTQVLGEEIGEKT